MPARRRVHIGLGAALIVGAATLFAASILADSLTRPHIGTPSDRTTAQLLQTPAGALPAPSSSDESGTAQTVDGAVAAVQPPAVSLRRSHSKAPAPPRPAPGGARGPSVRPSGVPAAPAAPAAGIRPAPEEATGSATAAAPQAEPLASNPPASEASVPDAAAPPAQQPAPPARPADPVISPPVPVDLAPPPHPHPYQMVVEAPGVVSAARLKGVEARVRLRLLVRSDGTVGRAEVAVASGRPELDAAAVAAALGWRFLPARRDGEPIASVALIWVAFTAPP